VLPPSLWVLTNSTSLVGIYEYHNSQTFWSPAPVAICPSVTKGVVPRALTKSLPGMLLFKAQRDICFLIRLSASLTFWTEILKPELAEKQITKQVARNLIILLCVWLLCGFIKHLWVLHEQLSNVLWRSQLDSPGLSPPCLCGNTHGAVGHCSYSGVTSVHLQQQTSFHVARGPFSWTCHQLPVVFFWWSYKCASLNYKMLT